MWKSTKKQGVRGFYQNNIYVSFMSDVLIIGYRNKYSKAQLRNATAQYINLTAAVPEQVIL